MYLTIAIPDIFHNISMYLKWRDIMSCAVVNKEFGRTSVNELRCRFNKIMKVIEQIKMKPQNITIPQLYNTKILDLTNRYGDAIPLNGIYIEPTSFGAFPKFNIKIPTELGQLANLEELHLIGNNLKTIPVELCNLHNLKILSLHQNELHNVPTELGHMHNLTRLYLGNNKLTSIPTELANLSNLKTIALFNNNIKQNQKQNIINMFGNGVDTIIF